MQRDDFAEFSTLLDGVFDLLGKTPAAKIVSAPAKAIFFQALAQHPMQAVRSALGVYVSRGEFTPTPGAINKIIADEAMRDGRLGPEEAWALALTSMDEADTVVWSTETAEAFRIARPVLSSSGAISARKTFLEAYERLVTAARVTHAPVEMVVSMGWDKHRMKLALHYAVKNRQIAAPQAQALLPAPDVDRKELTDSQRAQLGKVLAMLSEGDRKKQEQLARGAQERLGDEMAKDMEIAQKVAQYQADRNTVARMEQGIVEQAGNISH